MSANDAFENVVDCSQSRAPSGTSGPTELSAVSLVRQLVAWRQTFVRRCRLGWTASEPPHFSKNGTPDRAPRHGEARVRGTAVMECRPKFAGHSALMPANLITFAHRSVSSAMSLRNSAG